NNAGDKENEEDEGNDAGDKEDEEDEGKKDGEHEEENAKPKTIKRVNKDVTNIAPSARHVPATHLMSSPLRSGKPRDGCKVLFGYPGSWARTIYETI
ncbi:hypothetical protein MKW92_014402, partial [Papaver armeniacum]